MNGGFNQKDLLTIDNSWEHLFCHFGELIVSFLVVRLLDLRDLALRVDYEHFTKRHPYIHITHSVRLTVSKAAVKRRLLLWE